MLWPFNKYPGTDYETFNWEWMLGLGKKMEQALHDLFSDTGALHQMVDKVLGEHPEWTTTVQDGAIGYANFTDDVKKRFKNKLIFMPVPWSDTGVNSDCTVISTSVGKNIMFDTGHPTYWNTIAQTLRNNDITKIDVLIISHYHADHYANIENLIAEGFVTGDTVVYLPKIGYLHSSQLTQETDVISRLAAINATYSKPDSGFIASVDNVNIQFYNCNQDDMTYYDTDTPGDENNYSMCCNVTCGNNFVLGIYGDIGMKAQQRIYDQGWFIKNDIAKITHHANDETAYNNYYLTIMPEIGIAMQTAQLLGERQNTGYAYNVIPSYGGKMYSTGNGPIYAVFGEDGYYLEPNSENLSGGTTRSVTLYIDASYEGISNGSINKPYPTILQAVAAARKYHGLNVNIEPVNSYTSDEDLLIRDAYNMLAFKNITVNSITMYPGSIITFGNNVILTKDDDALSCNGAIISGDVTIPTPGARGAVFRNTRVNMGTVTISNKTTSFAALDNSDVFIDTLEGDNNTYGVSSTSGSAITVNTNNQNSTNLWDHNNELGGILGEFDEDISDLKTSSVTSASKMTVTRRDGYNVIHLDIGVSLSSGVQQITNALPRELRTMTPQRVPIVGRAGGAYATATNYIGELFIDNAHLMYLVFGNNYTNVNYVTCECVVKNLDT